ERPGRGPLDQDGGVPPGLLATLGVASPFVTDAEPAGHRPVAVDHQQLAVVARDELHRLEQVRATEGADLDPALAKAIPELATGPRAAEPVVQQPHLDALTRPRDQGVGEALAAFVVVDDVVLEMDPVAGFPDQAMHRLVGLRSVEEQLDRVARNRAGTGRTLEGAIDRIDHLLGRQVLDQTGVTHAVPSPSSRSYGLSAVITPSIISSRGTPSCSAPLRTSSRLTPRAKALSLSFFLTDDTSRSASERDGRTSA